MGPVKYMVYWKDMLTDKQGDAPMRDFDTQIELIKRFQNEYGHLKIPYDQIIYGVKLSRIVGRLRERYKKN